MVNYSNFALAMTTTRTVTKLDDDHLAIPAAVGRVVGALRQAGGAGDDMLCFSGINLIARPDGRLAVPRQDPLPAAATSASSTSPPNSVFTHDRRFERMPRPAGRRRFCGFLYWHLKYLKAGLGFANYELEDNPDSRFARRKERLETRPEMLGLPELRQMVRPDLKMQAAALLGDKQRTRPRPGAGAGRNLSRRQPRGGAQAHGRARIPGGDRLMRVLLINLDRSPERLAEFQAEAARCGLAFERLPAVDGRTLTEAEIAALVDPKFRFQPMGPGEIGIFLSHREAWRIAAAGPDRWTAVMEDDVRLADDVPALLAAIEEIDPGCRHRPPGDDAPPRAASTTTRWRCRPAGRSTACARGTAARRPMRSTTTARRICWRGPSASPIRSTSGCSIRCRRCSRR